MSGGYFGFTAPGGTQYNAANAYGAPTAGYTMTYAANPAAGYAAFNPASATAFAGAYNPAAAPQQPAPQPAASNAYATRLDSNTFQSSNPISKTSNYSAPSATSAKPSGGGNKSSYTGYDAAVYAAATSFLQSKAQGSGSQWLGLKRSNAVSGSTTMGPTTTGGGRGSFPRKQTGGPPRTQQLHYCEVCKISCAGPQTYREHLEGQKHKKKELQVKSGQPQPTPRSKVSFRCDLCQVTCTGQDTYQAHVRGAKHQKTLKLHQTLGKPIPSTEPVVIAPSGMGGCDSNQTPLGAGLASKKIVAVPKMNFVAGQRLTSSVTGPAAALPISSDPAVVAALQAEKDVQPVGEDYIEGIKDRTGKLVQYFCKLCDCKFNDLSAKDMHLKGKRHRLQFKKKVNPDLEVELKGAPRGFRRANEEKLRKELMRLRQQELWSMRAMYQGNMMAPTPLFSGAPKPLFGPNQGSRGESMDDRHVTCKHTAIYPTEEELAAVQKIVMSSEKALKAVSDAFTAEAKGAVVEQEKPAQENVEVKEGEGDKDKDKDKEEVKEEEKGNEPERLLKGVMRVGQLAKGLLLRGDMTVHLIVLCSEKPTKSLLHKVAAKLPEELQKATEDKLDVSEDWNNSCLMIQSTQEPKINLVVSLTSVHMRAEGALETTNKPDPPDLLPKGKCLEALADLRHAKWFQARCSNLQSCVITLRVMRDICQRIPTWAPISNWALELLVEKVLSSAGLPLSPGDALRRVFEAVASGVLLANGPGLLDPCEKDVIDACSSLTAQQREDITSSAQHALRLIAFNQLYKILGIERLADKPSPGRKRPRESTDGSDIVESTGTNGGKKGKNDDAEMVTDEGGTPKS